MECELGDFDRAEAYLGTLLGAEHWEAWSGAADPLAIALCGRIAGNARWPEAMKARIAQMLVSYPRMAPMGTLMCRMALGVVAVEGGDVAAVREQYAALDAMPRAPRVWWEIHCIGRLLGVMAHHIGEPEKAAAHFEEALAFCRQAGYRPELAWTCCDYADLLLERNSPGDHERAMALLDEGLAISREMGMKPLMERILSRRKILKA